MILRRDCINIDSGMNTNSNISILVSACLLGENCRFDGKSKTSSRLVSLLKDAEVLKVCPEVEGGLPIPRPPAEILGTRIVRESGEDVTDKFVAGSQKCVELAMKRGIKLAILKSRSPACGCGSIYDGSFSGTLTKGDGNFTSNLKSVGIACVSDEEYLNNNR